MTDEEIKEKVIRHDIEFKSLSESLKGIVSELHQITSSMRSVAVITEQIANMDNNLKESFIRVHKRISENEDSISNIKNTQNEEGCSVLKLQATEISALNRTVYGKDGRGGLIFDVEDIKKFMYKLVGAFTIVNIAIGMTVSTLIK